MKPRRSIRPASVLLAVVLAVIPASAQDGGLAGLVEKTAAAMTAENWQEALELNTQAVDRYGKDDPFRTYGAQFGAVYYRKGLCEIKLKRWQDALRSFEICYRDFPNQGAERGNPLQKMALLKWGEAAMGAGQWELAVNQFTKFTDERDKARDKFPQGAFYINCAVCHYQLGHLPAGNENLEIAIRNKGNFPTPGSGIIAGFQALVEAAIAKHDEQTLLDFIGKNRGGLILEPVEMSSYSSVFLRLAGDALAAGMQRAAISLYQLAPPTDAGPPEIVKLAAIALIHEKIGNVRGALAAYQQLELYFPEAADRENYLYHLVRTATRVGNADLARLYAGRLLRDFPQSTRLEEIRATGLDFSENQATPSPVAPPGLNLAGKPLPATPLFIAALDLYHSRKYQDAKAAFAEIKSRAKADRQIAAFYEMECHRKLGDLSALAQALRTFTKNSSLGSCRLRQLEINALWEALRTESWNALDQLAQARLHQRLPGDQRAQVAYCQGLALEKLGRPLEALDAYNIAMTADVGTSEECARQAALGVLRIHRADPEVQELLIGPEANRESPGSLRFKEAAAVAALFELTLGAGIPLPEEFKDFLKHPGGK